MKMSSRIFLLCAVMAAQAGVLSAQPEQISIPNSVSGMSKTKFVAVSNGKVYLAGDPGLADIKVSCLDVATRQKCSGAWPVSLKDSTTQAALKSASGMAVGKDGFIWVVSQSAHSVSRIDPGSGSYTNFDTAGIGAQGITVGLDGDIWVGNVNSNTMARFDSSGNMKGGFPALSGEPSNVNFVIGPRQFTTGLDGTIWSCIFHGSPANLGKVGRQADTGFPVAGYPRDYSLEPETLITAKDGDIFVLGSSQLIRINPLDGTVRPGYPKFIVLDPTFQGATIAPDGHLWFGRPILGDVTNFDPETDSIVDGYPLTIEQEGNFTAQPLGMAFDANENLWIAIDEPSHNRVVQLVLNPNIPTPAPTAVATAAPTPGSTGDECPDDGAKTAAGICGCGTADVDSNSDTVIDCGVLDAFSKSLIPNVASQKVVNGNQFDVLVENITGDKLTYEITLTGPNGFKKTIKSKNGKALFKKLKKGSYKLKVQIVQKVGKKTFKSKAVTSKFSIA